MTINRAAITILLIIVVFFVKISILPAMVVLNMIVVLVLIDLFVVVWRYAMVHVLDAARTPVTAIHHWSTVIVGGIVLYLPAVMLMIIQHVIIIPSLPIHTRALHANRDGNAPMC